MLTSDQESYDENGTVADKVFVHVLLFGVACNVGASLKGMYTYCLNAYMSSLLLDKYRGAVVDRCFIFSRKVSLCGTRTAFLPTPHDTCRKKTCFFLPSLSRKDHLSLGFWAPPLMFYPLWGSQDLYHP